MISISFPNSDREFEALRVAVAARIDLESRFPAWPFRGVPGYPVIFEFDRMLGGDFGAVLASLSDTYNDDEITVLGLEPPYAYYREEYDHFPGFGLKRPTVRAGYGASMRYAPDDDPTGALVDSLNVIAISGSTGSWAIFGQRDWEIGILLTADRSGIWLSAGVPSFDIAVDLDTIRSPAGWGLPLSVEQQTEFARQWSEHSRL